MCVDHSINSTWSGIKVSSSNILLISVWSVTLCTRKSGREAARVSASSSARAKAGQSARPAITNLAILEW